ncbi:DUF7680 family protein [Desulfonatronovibrio magnus]|uniref:DUF7680 family protein n=1 Tax=Desulfonatronovibrio magnus TaxID=698827 RepID=UPI000AD3E54D|nr:hypothetical protein [Desulfonatronovibrio magnus]
MKQKVPRDKNIQLQMYYDKKVCSQVSKAPWVLRITEHKDKPVPLFIIKQRIHPEQRTDLADLKAPRSILLERGLIYGPSQKRCIPVFKTILARVKNNRDIPMELQQFLNGSRIDFRGNLPLDDEAGYKMALIFKLQERIKEMDRVELIARRADRFTMEEAGYWYSRMSSFGDAANRWAMAGMKIMLAGQPRDPNIEAMLGDLR